MGLWPLTATCRASEQARPPGWMDLSLQLRASEGGWVARCCFSLDFGQGCAQRLSTCFLVFLSHLTKPRDRVGRGKEAGLEMMGQGVEA